MILLKPNSPQYLKKAKLITKGTIEERILELQTKKKILSENLIEGNADTNLSTLSEEDIKNLLIYSNE